jgi:formylglycine-generating enzyme required for sulfatase activity
MKKLTLVSALYVSVSLAAVPELDTDSISVRQEKERTVVISYELNAVAAGDTEPAVVTVDILTNAPGKAACSVGGEHLRTLSGDVNRLVLPGRHKILWKPHKEGMPEFKLPALQVTAKLTLWSTNSPPDYWIVDLTKPNDRFADRYYPDVGQIPLTVTNILYKTDRLVFRRIPAQGVTWKMGNTEEYNNYRYHYVTFSYDYYMAVYELTKSQFNKLKPGDFSVQDNVPLPSGYQLSNWRGMPTGASEYNWPSNGHEKVDKIMKSARSILGGIMVDLPTHSEWEFACRAGSATKYCNGDTVNDLDKVGWYAGNAGNRVHEVGLKEPNAWGMYDMHGNRAEWTLDKCSRRTGEPEWDPVGPMQDDADTGNSGDYKNKVSTVCGGGQIKLDDIEEKRWTSDKCTSGSGIGLLNGEGAGCAARLTIPLK